MTTPALGSPTWTAWPRRALRLGVMAYRLTLKPWLGNACRFEPSCSQYALDALDQHGAWAGACLTAGRLLRCHPWCSGGCDPVPARLFSPLLQPRGWRALRTIHTHATRGAGADRPDLH